MAGLRRKILACFANIQEGRDGKLLAELASVASSVPGAHLLRLFSDKDFHRSALLIAGAPEAVGKAVFALTGAAVARIDLCSPDRVDDT